MIDLLKAIVRLANQVEGTFETDFQLLVELFVGVQNKDFPHCKNPS